MKFNPRTLFFLSIYPLALLQATLLNHLAFLGVKPDLLLILVIFLALYRGKDFGLMAGIISGLMKDVLSASPFGLNCLCLGLCGLLVGTYAQRLNRDHLLIQLSLTLMGSLFTYLLYYLISAILGEAYPFGLSFWRVILPSAIYTTLIFPIIISYLFRKLCRI